jgi:hypothetical protein
MDNSKGKQVQKGSAMSTHSHYYTSGRPWAEGKHKIEAETVKLLWIIVIGSFILGMILLLGIGIFLGLWLDFPWWNIFPWWLTVLLVVVAGIVALFGGVFLARIIIPYIWQRKHADEIGRS